MIKEKKREILGRGGSFLNWYIILWRKKKSHFRKFVAFAWWNLEYSIKTINFFINAFLVMMFIIRSSKKLYCTTARAKYQLLSSWPTKYLLLKSFFFVRKWVIFKSHVGLFWSIFVYEAGCHLDAICSVYGRTGFRIIHPSIDQSMNLKQDFLIEICPCKE